MLASRYRTPVPFAVHHPAPDGDHRNVHIHALVPDREVESDGVTMGAKLRVLGDRFDRGPKEILALRLEWQSLVNRHLRDAGIDESIDMGRTRPADQPSVHAGPRRTGRERRRQRKANIAPDGRGVLARASEFDAAAAVRDRRRRTRARIKHAGRRIPRGRGPHVRRRRRLAAPLPGHRRAQMRVRAQRVRRRTRTVLALQTPTEVLMRAARQATGAHAPPSVNVHDSVTSLDHPAHRRRRRDRAVTPAMPDIAYTPPDSVDLPTPRPARKRRRRARYHDAPAPPRPLDQAPVAKPVDLPAPGQARVPMRAKRPLTRADLDEFVAWTRTLDRAPRVPAPRTRQPSPPTLTAPAGEPAPDIDIKDPPRPARERRRRGRAVTPAMPDIAYMPPDSVDLPTPRPARKRRRRARSHDAPALPRPLDQAPVAQPVDLPAPGQARAPMRAKRPLTRADLDEFVAWTRTLARAPRAPAPRTRQPSPLTLTAPAVEPAPDIDKDPPRPARERRRRRAQAPAPPPRAPEPARSILSPPSVGPTPDIDMAALRALRAPYGRRRRARTRAGVLAPRASRARTKELGIKLAKAERRVGRAVPREFRKFAAAYTKGRVDGQPPGVTVEFNPTKWDGNPDTTINYALKSADGRTQQGPPITVRRLAQSIAWVERGDPLDVDGTELAAVVRGINTLRDQILAERKREAAAPATRSPPSGPDVAPVRTPSAEEPPNRTQDLDGTDVVRLTNEFRPLSEETGEDRIDPQVSAPTALDDDEWAREPALTPRSGLVLDAGDEPAPLEPVVVGLEHPDRARLRRELDERLEDMLGDMCLFGSGDPNTIWMRAPDGVPSVGETARALHAELARQFRPVLERIRAHKGTERGYEQTMHEHERCREDVSDPTRRRRVVDGLVAAAGAHYEAEWLPPHDSEDRRGAREREELRAALETQTLAGAEATGEKWILDHAGIGIESPLRHVAALGKYLDDGGFVEGTRPGRPERAPVQNAVHRWREHCATHRGEVASMLLEAMWPEHWERYRKDRRRSEVARVPTREERDRAILTATEPPAPTPPRSTPSRNRGRGPGC